MNPFRRKILAETITRAVRGLKPANAYAARSPVAHLGTIDYEGKFIAEPALEPKEEAAPAEPT